MSHTVWGGESSKETVQCGYCAYTGRKDNLSKHINRIHGDKPFKWKRVAPNKQPAIKGFFSQSSGQDAQALGPPDSPGLEGVAAGGAKRHHSGEMKHPGVAMQITSGDIEPARELDAEIDTIDDATGDEIQILLNP